MNFIELLKKVVIHWGANPIADELAFKKFRDNVVDGMNSEEAFEAINETTNFLLLEDDESTAVEIMQTIIALARKSGTTEMPLALSKNIVNLKEKFDKFSPYSASKFRELVAYYRISIDRSTI